jgi:phosphate-selective porin OprO and OprP
VFKKKSLFILFVLAWLYKPLIAQDEDALPAADQELQDSAQKLSTNEMRVMKNYQLGDGLNFVSKNAQIQFTQSIQVLYGANTPDDLSSVGSEYRIRRARLNIAGLLFDDKIFFRLRLNLAGNYQSTTTGYRSFNNVVQDALIEYRPAPGQRINFGIRADYTDTREIRIEGESLSFIERSIVSNAFDAIFDYGIRYAGQFKLGGGGLFKPYASITTGDGTSALQQNFEGFKYGVRLDYLPFGAFSKGGEFYMDDLARERTPKLVFGVVYSYNNGNSSAKGTNGGRYIYGDSLEKILRPNLTKFGVDYLFKYRGFYSLGDFVVTHSTVPNNIAGEFSLSGDFVKYVGQTPSQIKSTVLSRINLGSGYNFQAGYMIDKYAVGGRYSHLNQDTESADFATINNAYSLIVTRYFYGNNLKLNMETGYEQFNKTLNTENFNGTIYLQIMLTVQF